MFISWPTNAESSLLTAQSEQGLGPLFGRNRLVIHDRQQLFLVCALSEMALSSLPVALPFFFRQHLPRLA
jgi:hypothetical protein